ncbi:hypothetical protein GBA52_016801 [Prunus armeniaca]|nr:hypothetical protein GBA52_016801 [Prunus armeniaca]
MLSYFAHLHSKDLRVLAATSKAMVQFMLVAFFFFIMNIIATFPFNLPTLLSVKTPLLNSLPRFEPVIPFEFKLTSAFLFMVESHPTLPFSILITPTVAPWY